MKRIQLKTLSMIAAVSLLLGVAGCKKTQQHKNRISGRVITENDPFYTAELVDMKIPLDESKELVHVQLDSGLISSDMVVFDYSISYEVPQELNARTLDKDQHPENYTAEEAEKIQAEYNSYYETGYVGFDHEGHILFRQTDDSANRSDFFVGPNGELLKLSRPYDEEARKVHTFICEVQRDGSQKNLVELVGKDDYDYFYGMRGLPDGRWIGWYDYDGIILFGKDGKEVSRIVDNEFHGFLYVLGEDVWVVCRHYDEDDPALTYFYLEKVDIDNGKMSGKTIRLEHTAREGLIQPLLTTGNEADKTILGGEKIQTDSLFYLDGNGIRKVDMSGNEQSSIYIDWNDVDMNRYGVIGTNARLTGECIQLIRNRFEQDGKERYGAMQVQLVTIRKADNNPYAGRTTVELGNRNINDERLLEYVLEYNRMTEHKIRIDVHDYSQDIAGYGAYDKVISGVEDQIYLNMLSGEGPDILANFSTLPQFSSDAVLLDLNSFIDGDGGLDRSRYYDSAFRSFEIGGKLYHIPVCMDVYGFVGDQRLLGESRILSLSELLEMQGRIEGTTRLFPVYSYEKMLDLLLPGSFSQFLDANSMTMNVTNEEFQSVLKVASVLGADPNPPGVEIHSETGYMAPDDYSPPEEQLQAGLVALIPATISVPEMYADYLKMLNGNAGVYGMEGGYSVGSDFTLGISKNTKFPKECWDFIRFLFEKEQQIQCAKDFYSIPLYREAAADICEEADLTDMEKSSFMEMLEKAYISRMSNYRIKEIILEEGMAYFKGQKSVEDVCQIIQNRVNTYMKEQYGKGTVS